MKVEFVFTNDDTIVVEWKGTMHELTKELNSLNWIVNDDNSAVFNVHNIVSGRIMEDWEHEDKIR